MAERELIEYIRKLAAVDKPPWATVGIGDDAAALEVPGGGQLVVTTDMVIEGVHFQSGTAARLVGRKAVARALSDIAAMAARPLCTLAAVNFGACRDETTWQELSRALCETAREFSAPLIGGDVASGAGPMSVTVTALGIPGTHGIITRAGAQPGDAICVTGQLGGSIRGRHLEFRPRIEEALALAERFGVHALIDISDGLSTDALHVAEASAVGMVLRASEIPISLDAVDLAKETGRPPIWHALNDGEDYELLFCLSEAQAQEVVRTGLKGTVVSIVGDVTSERESYLLASDGRREPLAAEGWEHLT